MLAVGDLAKIPGPVDTMTWYEKDEEQQLWHGVSDDILDGIFQAGEMDYWKRKRYRPHCAMQGINLFQEMSHFI